MTLRDITPRAQTEALTFEVELPHAPEKVWRALTDPALVSEWLLPAVGLELTPGATFRFEAPPQPHWDGVVACRVLEVEALRTLRYRWVVGDLDTVVTFALEPSAAGSRLRIEQSGFRVDQRQNFGGARYGWNLMGGRLVALLDRL